MEHRFKIRLNTLILSMLALCFLSLTVLAATEIEPLVKEPVTWFDQHWSVVALAVSEALSFLPIKANGIFHGAYNGICNILKKK